MKVSPAEQVIAKLEGR